MGTKTATRLACRGTVVRSFKISLVAPLICAGLVACGGGGGGNGAASLAAIAAPSQTPQAMCTSLASARVDASAIGRPTSGATVKSAQLIATDASNSSPEYCKVLGEIAPLDNTAPPINFQVNLPTEWNRKAVQFGGGGYDGSLVTADGPSVQAYDAPTPIARGYATFGSDSGHTADSLAASWAVNAEARQNWAGDQLKKTHDVAHDLIKKRYLSVPKRQYFAGGSQGGHEGFIAIQRFPADYDGVISFYPSYDFAGGVLAGVTSGQAFFAKPGSSLSAAKQLLLRKSVYAACDGLDGINDGIISNTTACDTEFKIATLRCASGADEGETCLSDQQIGALNVFNTRTEFGFALSGGTTSHTGGPAFRGGDVESVVFGQDPTSSTSSVLSTFVSQYVKYFITQDPNYDYLKFDPSAWTGQITAASAQVDAASVEIDAFRSKGGKFLLAHGLTDTLVFPGSSVDYYNRLVARFGQATVASFTRFYTIPGFGHGTGVFTASWDSLAVLDAWVENGMAPGQQVVSDFSAATKGRTRPLCQYGTWPKYGGSGDINAASSFACVNQ